MKLSARDYAKILFEITKDKKENEIGDILGGFISLLARSNDLKKADEIMKRFEEFHNSANGIVEVELRSSRKLSKDSLGLIKEYVSGLTNADKIIIRSEVDKDIIGGFVLKYGSTILDASLKNELQNLKYKMEK